MAAPFLTAIAPAAIGAISSFFSQMFGARSQRREYDKMRDYNTPASQMKRFTEAGLSPYLAYGQASSGNVSSPRPAEVLPDVGGKAAEALGNYMAMSNFDVDMKNKWMDYWGKQYQNHGMFTKNQIQDLEYQKKQLELYSDYPKLIDDLAITPEVVSTGFRRKLLELKRSASQALVERTQQSVQNLKYKNEVDKVKGRYATDFGMVGGDWTQGLGLIKSLPSLFKGARARTPSKMVPGKSFNQSTRDFDRMTDVMRKFKSY